MDQKCAPSSGVDMLTAATSGSKHTTSSYSGRVAAALAKFLHSGLHADIDDLARLLGHHYASAGPGTPDDETVAISAWVTVLRRYDRTSSASSYTERCVLPGLLRNDRWRTLFQCEADAYAFVIVLTRCLRRGDARKAPLPAERDAYRDLRRSVHSVMAAWFQPGIEPGQFTLRDLANALFGEAWCATIYDGCSDKISLPHLIESTKPPFLPGRLAADVVQHAENLPALD
jgi:hypothetical protein